jgi:hypothetical protein
VRQVPMPLSDGIKLVDSKTQAQPPIYGGV